jgi:hypothetical protein
MRHSLAMIAAAVLTMNGVATAESFPDRTVKIIVPTAPGGSIDATARKFPVNFPVSRELRAETGSTTTASSATYNGRFWNLRRKAPNIRALTQ